MLKSNGLKIPHGYDCVTCISPPRVSSRLIQQGVKHDKVSPPLTFYDHVVRIFPSTIAQKRIFYDSLRYYSRNSHTSHRMIGEKSCTLISKPAKQTENPKKTLRSSKGILEFSTRIHKIIYIIIFNHTNINRLNIPAYLKHLMVIFIF